MPYRLQRSLMLWFVFVLQAMTPFIHAHAGATQSSHAGFLHVHQNLSSDVAYPALSDASPGAEVEVAQGVPSRQPQLAVADVPAPNLLPLIPASIGLLATYPGRLGMGLAGPQFYLASSDHALPHALAPPLR